jgi:predicted AAA+ superfamily ATPase
VREHARDDPRGFLSRYRDGAVLDEVPRAPDLLSYIQAEVDERRGAAGLFVLTGSTNFALLHTISQSLDGRTALLNLLPMGLEEVRRFPAGSADLFDVLWRGSYPAPFDRGLEPGEWYPSYVETYLERDVRMVLNVGEIEAFQKFLRLSAGRAARLVNLSALGADAGVTHATARAWLSALEAGYVAWRLPPFHANVGKRLVRTPKPHFLDSGIVCFLLGIRSADQLRDHPLRGAVFETWVASEILKARAHRGLQPSLSFFRDRRGSEVDLVVETGRSVLAVETRSGQTVAEDFFAGLRSFAAALGRRASSRPRPVVVRGARPAGAGRRRRCSPGPAWTRSTGGRPPRWPEGGAGNGVPPGRAPATYSLTTPRAMRTRPWSSSRISTSFIPARDRSAESPSRVKARWAAAARA